MQVIQDPGLALLSELIATEETVPAAGALHTGVDLGTADVVLTVLDEDGTPVAGRLRWTNVVREGLIFDFANAVRVVRTMKEEIESALGRKLERAAGALPPGIVGSDAKAVGYALEEVGFDLTGVVDEPSAAARALGIRDGAVVDIGGGTTGISILRNGEICYTADEATGGRHMTLVLAGRYDLSLEDAERLKIEQSGTDEVREAVRPVIEKMSAIIQHHIYGHDVGTVYLVGGPCGIPGMAEIVEETLNVPTARPEYPMLATPMGIAKVGIGR